MNISPRWNSELWLKFIIGMKIDHFYENSSLWWTFIIEMQYDFGWNIKRLGIHDSIIRYEKSCLLGKSWCNSNMKNNYWLDKDSSHWGYQIHHVAVLGSTW